MKKLQRRQQQNNVNEINEKKSKKRMTNDTVLNHYMFDEDGENIGEKFCLIFADEQTSIFIMFLMK